MPANAAPRPNRTVTVYLVRHGQTWMNYTGRVQGWSDSPLTEQGITVAAQVGRNLAAEIGGFDAAYCADTVRHYQTATGMLGPPGRGSSRRASSACGRPPTVDGRARSRPPRCPPCSSTCPTRPTRSPPRSSRS
ncbi:phosphoglycerate mutase family protein [Tessaracoccus coleopterorum]|uniref:phosphoglycerate mutase family protein n=1 Tax=Tessaracoccus coleopterorum TaxID=2714950 RepID=UPI002F90D939